MSQLLQARYLQQRAYTADQRRAYAASGVALPDGSFPIPDASALKDALHRIGTAGAGKRAQVIAHIKKRARALGVSLADSSVMKNTTLLERRDAIRQQVFSAGASGDASFDAQNAANPPLTTLPQNKLPSQGGPACKTCKQPLPKGAKLVNPHVRKRRGLRHMLRQDLVTPMPRNGMYQLDIDGPMENWNMYVPDVPAAWDYSEGPDTDGDTPEDQQMMGAMSALCPTCGRALPQDLVSVPGYVSYSLVKQAAPLVLQQMPLLQADGLKRVVTVPILIPDVPVVPVEPTDVVLYYPKEVIKQAAWDFLEKSRTRAIGVDHNECVGPEIIQPNGEHAVLVESFIAPTLMQIGSGQVPEGTWVGSFKITDPLLWNDVLLGRMGSVSISSNQFFYEFTDAA